MRIVHLNKRGDTIVEVLLAVAIVAAVLAGGYVATNRSIKVGRDAQERSEATELAKSQVEKLKYYSTDNSKGIYDGAAYFCIDNAGNKVAITNIDSPTTYDASCAKDYYSLGIERTTLSGRVTFIVRVLWPGITGNTTSVVNGTTLPGYSEVKMYYRIEP